METVPHSGMGCQYLQAVVTSTGKVCLETTRAKPHRPPGGPQHLTTEPLYCRRTGTPRSHIKPPESTFLACDLPASSPRCPAALLLQLGEHAGRGSEESRVPFSWCLNCVVSLPLTWHRHWALSICPLRPQTARRSGITVGPHWPWRCACQSRERGTSGGWHPWGRGARWPGKGAAGISRHSPSQRLRPE